MGSFVQMVRGQPILELLSPLTYFFPKTITELAKFLEVKILKEETPVISLYSKLSSDCCL